MKVKDMNGIKALYAEDGMKITDKNRKFFLDYIYLAKSDSVENYEEVDYTIWKNYIQEDELEIEVLRKRVKDLEKQLEDVKNSNADVIDNMLLALVDISDSINAKEQKSRISRFGNSPIDKVRREVILRGLKK